MTEKPNVKPTEHAKPAEEDLSGFLRIRVGQREFLERHEFARCPGYRALLQALYEGIGARILP